MDSPEPQAQLVDATADLRNLDITSSSDVQPNVNGENNSNKKKSFREKREEKKFQREKSNPVIFSPDRSKYLAGAGTGEKFNERRWTRPATGEVPSDKVEIRKDVVEGHSKFLKEHLRSLLKIGDSRLLDGDYHAASRYLLDHFTNEKGDDINTTTIEEFAKTDEGIILTQQIMDMRLNDMRLGLGIAFSAAYHREIQDPSDRSTVVNIDAVNRMFTGRWGNARRSGLGRFSDRRAIFAGASMGALIGTPIGGALGNVSENIPAFVGSLKHLTESQVGAIFGGLGGAIGGGIFGRKFLTNNGDIDFNILAEGFDVIDLSGDREYLKAISGIDINDFELVDGQIVWREGVNPADLTTNVSERLTEIREMLVTRQKLYKSIDRPRASSRTVPFTPIGGNELHSEETDTVWGRKIQETRNQILENVTGGVREPTLFERIQADRLARVSVLTLDLANYLETVSGKSYIEERGWVSSTTRVTDLEKAIDHAKTNSVERKTSLENRITALNGSTQTNKAKTEESEGNEGKSEENNGAGQLGRLKGILKEYTERIKTSRTIINGETKIISENSELVDSTGIETVDDLLAIYEREIRSVNRRISNAPRQPRTDLRRAEQTIATLGINMAEYTAHRNTVNELSGDIDQQRRFVSDTRNATQVNSIQTQIDAIDQRLSDPGITVGDNVWRNLDQARSRLEANPIYSNYLLSQDAIRRHDSARTYLNSLTVDQRTAIREYEIVEKSLGTSEGVERQLTKLEDRKKKLEEARGKIRKENQQLNEKRHELEDKEKQFSEQTRIRLENDRNFFIAMDITDEQLRIMQVGELLSTINEMYNVDSEYAVVDPRGWAQNQNNNQSNLDRLVNAMIEARYRGIIGEIRDAQALLIAGGLDIDEISEFSGTEINSRMNELYQTSAGTEGWPIEENDNYTNEIYRARQIRVDRDLIREESVRLVQKEIEREVQQLSEQTTALSNGELVARADAVKDKVLKEQSAIFTTTNSEFRDGDKREKYFSLDIPGDDDDFYTSVQERNFNQGQRVETAYYEFLNLIFKYQSEGDRGLAFHRASMMLPPDELARILREQLGLIWPDNNVGPVLREARLNFMNGTINERNMRNAVQHIITFVEGRAKAMLN